MKLNNGKFFVFIFITSALVFSLGLVWFAKTQQNTDLSQFNSDQLKSLFTAHASKAGAVSELKLVQLQQVEILNPEEFQNLISEFPFLKEISRLHINVTYNFTFPLEQNFKLSYSEGRLALSDYHVQVYKPVYNLQDVRLEKKSENVELKISDEQVKLLMAKLEPYLTETKAPVHLQKNEASLKEELTQHVVTWLRLQHVKALPQIELQPKKI